MFEHFPGELNPIIFLKAVVEEGLGITKQRKRDRLSCLPPYSSNGSTVPIDATMPPSFS
jgi:hypothetical protein